MKLDIIEIWNKSKIFHLENILEKHLWTVKVLWTVVINFWNKLLTFSSILYYKAYKSSSEKQILELKVQESIGACKSRFERKKKFGDISR